MMRHSGHARRLSKRAPEEDKKGLLPGWAVACIDILLIGAALCLFALFHHVIPRVGNGPILEIPRPESSSASVEDAASKPALEMGDKFLDKFTQNVQKSQNHYSSPDIHISIEEKTVEIRRQPVVYFIADIYVRSIDNFRTAFARGIYGRSIAQDTLDMAVDNKAVLAISGDYYGTNDQGTVIRNGRLYRRNPTQADAGVLFWNGVMETYSPGNWHVDVVLKRQPYQAWTFGPMLLQDGRPMTKFNSVLMPANPRAAIGYFEPGHYCFVLVDGRRAETYSAGMRLEALSQLFYDLGCKQAYNLDGGQSAVMVFDGKVVNQPVGGGRPVSDIVYITERE